MRPQLSQGSNQARNALQCSLKNRVSSGHATEVSPVEAPDGLASPHASGLETPSTPLTVASGGTFLCSDLKVTTGIEEVLEAPAAINDATQGPDESNT